jgi:hypothetical protein
MFLLVATSAFGALVQLESYRILDLGDIRIAALAKDDSRVVGFSGDQQPIQVYPTFQILPGLPGATLKGEIVGTIISNLFFADAYLFQVATGNLEDLGKPNFSSYATCLNSSGDIWGYGHEEPHPSGDIAPLIWINMESHALPTLYGRSAWVGACNDVGDSAGSSLTLPTPTGSTHECTHWLVSGQMLSCHPSEATMSRAKDMNNLAQILGDAVTIYGSSQLGYIWGGYYMVWLRPLPGDTIVHANGLNDLGDAVGQSCHVVGRDAICQAIRWDYQVPVPLASKVTNIAGWNLQNAIDIANDGNVLVEGTLNGQPRAGLLIPTDPAYVNYWNPRFQPWIDAIRGYWENIRAWWRTFQKAQS